MSETVLLNYEHNVATLTLNRPDQLNAMDQNLLNELLEKLKQINESDAQVVVLTGAGKAFSAGGDIKTMLQSSSPEDFTQVMNTIKEIMLTYYTMPRITISAINGAAAGLGFSMALASDFLISSPKAKLAMNFIGIGLIPDGGGHFFLEQRLGPVRAKQTIWEGKLMSANEAYEAGLVDTVTSEDFSESLNQYVGKLLASPLKAMIETKTIYADYYRPKLENYLEKERTGQSKMRQTKDHQEGIQAFLEKRKPNFKGE